MFMCKCALLHIQWCSCNFFVFRYFFHAWKTALHINNVICDEHYFFIFMGGGWRGGTMSVAFVKH